MPSYPVFDSERLHVLETGQARIEGTLEAVRGLTDSVNQLSTNISDLDNKVDRLKDTVTDHHASLTALLEERNERQEKAKEQRRLFWKLAIPVIAAVGGAVAAACGHQHIAGFFHQLGG